MQNIRILHLLIHIKENTTNRLFKNVEKLTEGLKMEPSS